MVLQTLCLEFSTNFNNKWSIKKHVLDILLLESYKYIRSINYNSFLTDFQEKTPKSGLDSMPSEPIKVCFFARTYLGNPGFSW